jgi:hypothetical protein
VSSHSERPLHLPFQVSRLNLQAIASLIRLTTGLAIPTTGVTRLTLALVPTHNPHCFPLEGPSHAPLLTHKVVFAALLPLKTSLDYNSIRKELRYYGPNHTPDLS